MVSKTEQLEAEGWERRSILSEPRLSEAVELYRDLGFDVRVEPYRPEEDPAVCTQCLREGTDRYGVVFVKRG